MKKKILATTLAIATLSLGVFSGCSLMQNTVAVTSIEFSHSEGLVDVYVITYSDGTTSELTVTNGKNGTDGKDGSDARDVTAEDVYETYKSIYGEELTFKQFCELYLTVDNDNTAALNSALCSCVKVYMPYTVREFRQTVQKNSVGSGVIYRMDEDYTYILTNYHVAYIDEAYGEKLRTHGGIYLYGSESEPALDENNNIVYGDLGVECDYVGGSIAYDVAVLKVDTADVLEVNPQASPVKISYDFSVGEETYAVGNADGQGICVTKGVVSVDSDIAVLDIDGKDREYRSIRTDTAITHGNSGGGLFNMQGELIGLNNAGREDITFMNYAIPASVLTAVADGIMYYNAADGTVKTTFVTRLGVTIITQNSRYVYDPATGKGDIYEETAVYETSAGSLSALAGLKKDDIITSMTLNGKTTEITRQFKITDVLLNTRAGDTLVIGYKRGGVAAQSPELTVRARDLVDVDKID